MKYSGKPLTETSTVMYGRRLSRRDVLSRMGAVVAGLGWSWHPSLVAAAGNPAGSFLLSRRGCGRATGYAESNKIVTWRRRTHVAWLDSPPEGFRVRVRSCDRHIGEWSPTVTVGDAFDNHGGPALTVDSKGHLHIVYFPHHHPMCYRRSRRPGDSSEWEKEVRFGERLTYPTLVCGPDDRLFLSARRSYPDRPWEVELWEGPPGARWQRRRALLRSRHPGYSHFQESLTWGPDHRTLHLFCRFHERSDSQAYGRLQTVAYLVSPDAGRTWTRSDGTPVSLPATPDSAEVLARGGVDHNRLLRAGALSVDPGGRPCVVYSNEEGGRSRLILARPNGDGSWDRTDLSQFLPVDLQGRLLLAPAGVTFTSGGEMVVSAQIEPPVDGASTWGGPGNEVVAFRSRDGGRSFTFSPISRPDGRRAHWLPNIERATGHNQVPEEPGLLYTGGGPGAKNTDLLSNHVFFVTSA